MPTISNTNERVKDSQVTFTDITTGNASTSNHGFLVKLSGSSTDVLKGDGTFGAAPSGTFNYASTLALQAVQIIM